METPNHRNISICNRRSFQKEPKIVGPGEAKDAHLMCQVKLTVRAPGTGKETKKALTYIISTAPNLTVSRKVF